MTTYANHIRTMLLNQEKGAFGATFPGEEYVAAAFRPRTLGVGVAKVRTALFGESPDRQTLNFRLHQIMQAIYATDMAAYMTYHDDRITYLPLSQPEWFDATVDRPTRTMVDVIADLDGAVGGFEEVNLFGENPDEPYRTFRNLWRGHDIYAYRLAGIALALAFRTSEA